MSTPFVQKVMSFAKQDLEAACAGQLDMAEIDMLCDIGSSGLFGLPL